MRKALDQNTINGILIDSYVAGYYHRVLDNYQLNKVFKTQKAYGFVLGRRFSTSAYYNMFQSYYEANKEDILALVMNSTNTPKVSRFIKLIRVG